MSDLISREAVFNTLENMDKVLDENRTVEAYKDLLTECFKDLPPVEPQEWISVKDGLPNEECECWITLEYIKTGNRVLYESHHDPELGFYNQKSLERKGYKLVAWQKKRMPSPYTGK